LVTYKCQLKKKSAMEQLFCVECGSKNQLHNKFCSGCGSKLSQPSISLNQEGSAHLQVPTTNRVLSYDGSIYEGDLTNGVANGQGKLIYPESDGDSAYHSWADTGLIYQGGFLNGKKHGSGKLYNDNFSYDGEWRQNQKHGFGRLLYTVPNSSQRIEYIGAFSEDQKNGRGKEIETGDTLYPYEFEGTFSQNSFEYGILTGSFMGENKYTLRFEGKFIYEKYKFNDDILKVLDRFPVLEGTLVFTWLNDNSTTTHIVAYGKSESYEQMREERFDEDDLF
jgi:hypothetical protein